MQTTESQTNRIGAALVGFVFAAAVGLAIAVPTPRLFHHDLKVVAVWDVRTKPAAVNLAPAWLVPNLEHAHPWQRR